MKETHHTNLSFEKAARGDVRVWLTLVAGCILLFVSLSDLFGSSFGQVAEAPTWLNLVFVFAGLGMAGLSAVCLAFNTSRGCLIDEKSQELVWWQMKFSHQQTHQKSRVKLHEIGKLRIDASNDGLALSLFGVDGQRHDGFSEAVLPPDYEKWCDELAAIWPQISVEKA